MARMVLLLDLVNDADAIARYDAWHRAGAVPPAVVRSIRDAGIMEMEIFRADARLAMVLETGPAFDPAAKAAADRANPDVVAWERLMDEVQRPVPGADPASKWTAARRIFALDEQP